MKCPDCGKENLEGADDCQYCSSPRAPRDAARGMEKRILEGTASLLSPRPAVWASPSDTLEGAVKKMREEKVGCVLVLVAGRLVGVLSEWELLLRASDGPLGGRTVEQVMRPESTCLSETDGVAFAFNQLASSGYRHMPVRMKDGSYGVISARDLLSYLCQ